MPNWCENDLTVTGPTADLDRFIAGGLDFNTAIPYPDHFKQMDDATHAWEQAHPYGSDAYKAHWQDRPKDGYNQGGYDWCIAHWGCKWNASTDETLQRISEEKAEGHFSTPWAPPMPVIDAWSAKYPSLTFVLKYFEGGMGFQGVYRVRKGRVLSQHEGRPLWWHTGRVGFRS